MSDDNTPSVACEPRGWQRLAWRWHSWRARVRGWLLEDGATRGLGGPPNNWQMSGEYRGRWASQGESYRGVFLDDAGSIGISVKWPDGEESWKVILPATVFRRLALWYLARWAYGEWFGLRRWLFYRDLRRRVAAHRRLAELYRGRR